MLQGHSAKPAHRRLQIVPLDLITACQDSHHAWSVRLVSIVPWAQQATQTVQKATIAPMGKFVLFLSVLAFILS